MAIWAGIITAIVGAGLSAGVAAASQPDYVNPASSSRSVSLAALRALPGQRMLDSAARLGQRVEYPTGKKGFNKVRMTLQEALDQGHITQAEFDRRLESTARGNDNSITPETEINVKVPKPKTAVADFTGYGDADIQGRLAKEMAKIQLELQQKYGTDFIDEARKQQELADPEGTEARKLLASEINRMEEERKTRQRPVAGTLDSQVLDELNRGTGLADDQTAAIEQVLRNRGDTNLTGGDVADELEGGPAGEARKQARIQKSLAYLSSGAAPEDAAYRERQQSLANMANFLSGRTPQSQFKSLSGGQQGASPTPQGPSLPNVQPGMQGQADNAALQSYGQGIRATANNVSPWFAGLNMLTQGLNVAGSAGWKPYGQQKAA